MNGKGQDIGGRGWKRKPMEISWKRVVIWTLIFTDAFFVSYFMSKWASLI